MIIARTIAGAALLAIAVSAPIEAHPARQPLGPTREETVALRQASMVMAAATTGNVKAALERGAPAKAQTFALRGVAKWAENFSALFAPSTRGVAGTRAKPEIWTDRTAFWSRATALSTATKAAVRAAEADDKAALTTAMTAVSDACKGCHDTFQVPPPPPAKTP